MNITNYIKEKKNFFQYKELIELLTKKLNKKVIIRPHPSEGIKGWKDALKGFENVFIKKNEIFCHGYCIRFYCSK